MPLNHEDTKITQNKFRKLSDYEESLATKIVNAANKVHKELGPGLLEKVYEVCFCHELNKMGIKTKGR